MVYCLVSKSPPSLFLSKIPGFLGLVIIPKKLRSRRVTLGSVDQPDRPAPRSRPSVPLSLSLLPSLPSLATSSPSSRRTWELAHAGPPEAPAEDVVGSLRSGRNSSYTVRALCTRTAGNATILLSTGCPSRGTSTLSGPLGDRLGCTTCSGNIHPRDTCHF